MVNIIAFIIGVTRMIFLGMVIAIFNILKEIVLKLKGWIWPTN
jgi:hypothetical protein